MNFELTRAENDEALLSEIDSIKTAENIKVLIPFAKAYLGMFYVIDKALAEKEKVKLLANNELAEAIFSGFLSCLHRSDLPSIEKIAYAKAEQKEYAEGYVFLAGLDLIAKKSLADINLLSLDVIEKAIGFHFSNRSGYHNIWFDYLLKKQKEKVIPAVSMYWVTMLKNRCRYLPGKNLILGEKADVEIIRHCILPILDSWTNCKIKTLFQLLQLAFVYSDTSALLVVCERVLANNENLNERSRLYWLATAYLISPDKYFAKLAAYVGRVKLKIMPLLDFIVVIISNESKSNIKLNAKIIVQLLRIIAPVFPPQHHVYSAIGALDINSKNVMLMFYYLATVKEEGTTTEIKKLRKARVMKIYSAVIDNLLEIRAMNSKNENVTSLNFTEYVEILIKNNCLQSRSNKFDLR